MKSTQKIWQRFSRAALITSSVTLHSIRVLSWAEGKLWTWSAQPTRNRGGKEKHWVTGHKRCDAVSAGALLLAGRPALQPQINLLLSEIPSWYITWVFPAALSKTDLVWCLACLSEQHLLSQNQLMLSKTHPGSADKQNILQLLKKPSVSFLPKSVWRSHPVDHPETTNLEHLSALWCPKGLPLCPTGLPRYPAALYATLELSQSLL